MAPNGQFVRRSAKTTDRRLAQEFHDRLKSESWRVVQLNQGGLTVLSRQEGNCPAYVFTYNGMPVEGKQLCLA